MTRRGKDTMTLDLFRDWNPPEVAVNFSEEVTKGGSLDVKIARAVSEAMQRCGKPREQIAEEMSDYLGGQNVTANMLDTYASPARRDHKITLERLIALVNVTECHDLLGFVCGFSNFIAIPERYGEIIELWLTEEQMSAMENHRASLRGRVKGFGR